MDIKNLREMSRYRKGHILISIIVVILSIVYHKRFLNECSTNLETLSYIGTVATFIGVVIAVLEILHSVSISSSIRDESQKLLSRYKALNKASTSSECVLILDEVRREYSKGDYATALRCFQYFRRLYLTINYEDAEIKRGNPLDLCETFLQQMQHEDAKSPMPNSRKNRFLEAISTLKTNAEKIRHSKED